MCEKYNGWTNRETWALQLWIDNDQGLSGLVEERVRGLLAHGYDDDADASAWLAEQPARRAQVAGEAVKDLWEELTDPSEGLMSADKILEMVRDVGSEYRISWDEIGAAWLATISEDES